MACLARDEKLCPPRDCLAYRLAEQIPAQDRVLLMQLIVQVLTRQNAMLMRLERFGCNDRIAITLYSSAYHGLEQGPWSGADIRARIETLAGRAFDTVCPAWPDYARPRRIELWSDGSGLALSIAPKPQDAASLIAALMTGKARLIDLIPLSRSALLRAVEATGGLVH